MMKGTTTTTATTTRRKRTRRRRRRTGRINTPNTVFISQHFCESRVHEAHEKTKIQISSSSSCIGAKRVVSKRKKKKLKLL